MNILTRKPPKHHQAFLNGLEFAYRASKKTTTLHVQSLTGFLSLHSKMRICGKLCKIQKF